MPEVVEVALTANYLNEKLKNYGIKDINILGGRYSRNSLQGINEFKKKLPFTIKCIDSKGKFLWFELNKNFFILNTFGLSGEWGFDKKTHSNVELKLTNGNSVYFTDPRNFGTIILTNDNNVLYDKLDSLGPDLLKTDFTNDMFYDYIKNYLHKKDVINKTKKDKKIIQVLMNQTFSGGIGSGLGNYLAVEVLYRAKMSPHRKIYTIYKDRKLCDILANSIKYVTRLSYMTMDIGYLSDTTSDMGKWIKKLRDNISNKYNYHSNTKIGKSKFKFKVYRQQEDPDGNKIKAEKDIIKGRTTYWSSTVQK